MSPCKVIHSCMLCHYKLAGPLLFLLFLQACMCEFIHNGRCVPAVVHRFEEGVLVLMFLFTDLKKKLSKCKISILLWYWLLSAENFMGKMLTLALLYLGSNISGWDVLCRLGGKGIHFYVSELLLIACIQSGWLYKLCDNLPEFSRFTSKRYTLLIQCKNVEYTERPSLQISCFHWNTCFIRNVIICPISFTPKISQLITFSRFY